ncbi:MAG: asparagine synthase (glutamine-hydrolyzing) [candidate division Zixibacteria bacterium]|nr:asparagine synthase (glutamine-hydrolyzing) [candidate division Zixibacteria bacterium]
MCGIAGYFKLKGKATPDRELITRMVNAIKHRGPDEFGAYFDNVCSLGQARLSIIDLSTGSQPLCNEDGTIWISFNGEIYNYIELRPELEKLGHVFKTQSDTEVIVHAYEQWGRDCVKRFNGQFAFAIYNKSEQSLFLVRDRMGIRPAFYTIQNGRFYFASEMKSIFCDPSIPRRLDMRALDETFSWWTSAPPRTPFENINELEAGTWIEVKNGEITKGRYWQMDFPESFDYSRPIEDYAAELKELLTDAVRLRLRADVPVGAYLSGGLDSAVITALIRQVDKTRLETFSVTFDDDAFDESEFQKQMAEHLGTSHHTVSCDYKSIAESFPKVIWHTERPIIRTAPTPLYLLSGLVRENDFKVVLTGEGSDEILGGYDIYKETVIRAFWAKNPDSEIRPKLLKKLYPTLPVSGARAKFYLEQFYKSGLEKTGEYYFSHIPRFNTTSKIKDFLTSEARNAVAENDTIMAFGNDLPEKFDSWHHLPRAQFLESKSLLAGYLLSSQGDRVSAANSIEGRFPFLDHRVVEFASTIPPGYKIWGLNEKYVLKKAMLSDLPKEITARVKQPYMAPDSNSFVQKDSPEYITELLSEVELKKSGLFNPVAVSKLYKKCSRFADSHLSFKDNMSFVGILSTQLLHQQFIESFPMPENLPKTAFSVWHDESQ